MIIESGITNSNLEVISRKQICKQIGVSKDTIRNWIDKRSFPKPLIASDLDPLFNFKEAKDWLHNNDGIKLATGLVHD